MDDPGLVAQLRELVELHATGAITDEEFAVAKTTVLHGPGRGGVPSVPVDVHDPAPQPVASGGAPPVPGRVSGAAAPAGPDARNLVGSLRGAAVASPAATARWAGRGGAVACIAGGLVTLLAFLVMPLATLPFLGPVTAAGAAGLSSEFGVLGLLYLVPLFAAGVVGTAGWQVVDPGTPSRRRVALSTVLLLAGLVVLVYVVVLGAVQAQVSQFGGAAPSFTGAGFWFALFGMFVAGIGAPLDMASTQRAAGDVIALVVLAGITVAMVVPILGR